MPSVFKLLFMGIAAMIAGGIWAFIPAIFKAKMGTNETIFTLISGGKHGSYHILNRGFPDGACDSYGFYT